MYKKSSTSLFVVVVLCALQYVYSEKFYWIGPTSGDWDSRANWNTLADDGVPGQNDDVFINTNASIYRMNSEITVNSLTIGNGDVISVKLTTSYFHSLRGIFVSESATLSITTETIDSSFNISGAFDFDRNTINGVVYVDEGGVVTINGEFSGNIQHVINYGSVVVKAANRAEERISFRRFVNYGQMTVEVENPLLFDLMENYGTIEVNISLEREKLRIEPGDFNHYGGIIRLISGIVEIAKINAAADIEIIDTTLHCTQEFTLQSNASVTGGAVAVEGGRFIANGLLSNNIVILNNNASLILAEKQDRCLDSVVLTSKEAKLNITDNVITSISQLNITDGSIFASGRLHVEKLWWRSGKFDIANVVILGSCDIDTPSDVALFGNMTNHGLSNWKGSVKIVGNITNFGTMDIDDVTEIEGNFMNSGVINVAQFSNATLQVLDLRNSGSIRVEGTLVLIKTTSAREAFTLVPFVSKLGCVDLLKAGEVTLINNGTIRSSEMLQLGAITGFGTLYSHVIIERGVIVPLPQINITGNFSLGSAGRLIIYDTNEWIGNLRVNLYVALNGGIDFVLNDEHSDSNYPVISGYIAATGRFTDVDDGINYVGAITANTTVFAGSGDRCPSLDQTCEACVKFPVCGWDGQNCEEGFVNGPFKGDSQSTWNYWQCPTDEPCFGKKRVVCSQSNKCTWCEALESCYDTYLVDAGDVPCCAIAAITTASPSTSVNPTSTTGVDSTSTEFSTSTALSTSESADVRESVSDGSVDIAIIITVVAVLVAVITIAGIIWLVIFLKRRRNTRDAPAQQIELSSNTKVKEKKLKNVKIGHVIGRGNFGEVYKGEWQGAPVALKSLLPGESVKEIAMLNTLNHPNIVRYFGIFEDKDHKQFLVMEYMTHGSLNSFLQMEQANLKLPDLLNIAKQVATGMSYLEQEKVVHRDLAARNILISKGGSVLSVKIADFGLSRVTTEKEYYKAEKSSIPMKWSALESIQYGRFSSKSDVWSFGVTLWEIFAFGEIPYKSMTNKEAVDAVFNGYRMPCPRNCPQVVYELMLKCWQEENLRPTFGEVVDMLKQIEIQLNVETLNDVSSQSVPSTATTFYS